MIRQLKDITSISQILYPVRFPEDLPEIPTNIIYYLIVTDQDTLDNLNPYLAGLFDTVYHLEPLSHEYMMNRLDKLLSPLYDRLITYWVEGEESGGSLDYSVRRANIEISRLILNKFLEKWNRLANAMLAEYNPISNYDMEEHKEEDNDRKVNTDMTSETENGETTKYAGYNSGATLPVAGETEGSSETTTTGLAAKNESIDDNEYTLTRKGNIGVTTSQQMIESEIKLREKNLLDIIFADLDSILFLDYYK